MTEGALAASPQMLLPIIPDGQIVIPTEGRNLMLHPCLFSAGWEEPHSAILVCLNLAKAFFLSPVVSL
jgi:hypothetical protein